MTQVSGDITSGEMTFIRLERLANRVLKQQRRRRLRKRQLKSEFALLQTLSRLFHFVYFVKCWQMFLELNSKGLRYQSSGKEFKRLPRMQFIAPAPNQNPQSASRERGIE